MSNQTTLAIDVGGSGLKAAVLGPDGDMRSDRVRVKTPRPAHPDRLVSALRELVAELPAFDRVSVGFPGMVRDGRVLTAPNLVRSRNGKISHRAAAEWEGFDLAERMAEVLGRPTKVVNDASVQGAAVVTGVGLEWAVTLGTGFGTALFWGGQLTPNLEFSHHPLHRGKTYDEYLGNAARRAIGNKAWSRRVRRAVETLDTLSNFDRIFVGGGNSRHVKVDLGPKAQLIDNSAGILGGVRIWET
jgi:polyphosphate glucokinase